jgi:hypothetical protein
MTYFVSLAKELQQVRVSDLMNAVVKVLAHVNGHAVGLLMADRSTEAFTRGHGILLFVAGISADIISRPALS